MTRRTSDNVTRGSGNVFADLGFEDADDRLAKSELTIRIAGIVRERRLTQAATAKLLGIDQPKVSRLLNGRLHGFSTGQLMRFLTDLGHDVEIVVREKPRKSGARLTVSTA